MDAEKCLRKYDIKVTKARLNILNLLSKMEDAVSAEEILKKFTEKDINVDLSTIYRTLELFEVKKIIRKIDLGQGEYSYAIIKENHKHILQCKICHKQIEIDCPMQQVEEIIKNKTGFVFVEEKLDFKIKGICKDCRKKMKKNMN
ncbi:Fur family transcriptional regulator [Clostridium luticellarii]|jgi:Fe2+ or Zn2+ uptake regulation protein|uniref:Zinc uptake regulation protein n=1 Tax=Clostridium luticellarii TaxID=1691940 RepID=A0A2T0BBW0_9CLOT|nr:Fur family transcriptional regulator [Clostridium luticellarii]MCI1944501.1 transcriptional repressor [Clostridium luticellarii]MCI1968000.1 transcriptional repressor [Clostridium luticellarii]MCI1995061.1 transcriptional repressor [Clostridium luticellarii]MCI2039220.1 transcriptional repressor [Clostridium luticellarii]PRR81368.1 Zinc uptake regulation protein [Clostridium luticellarii]